MIAPADATGSSLILKPPRRVANDEAPLHDLQEDDHRCAQAPGENRVVDEVTRRSEEQRDRAEPPRLAALARVERGEQQRDGCDPRRRPPRREIDGEMTQGPGEERRRDSCALPIQNR